MAITLANNANWAMTQQLLVNEQIQDTLFANKIHLQEDISADAEVNVENPARSLSENSDCSGRKLN